MTEDKIDLKKLAEEAAQEAYSPRAQFCWPWSHQWTMWKQARRDSIFWHKRCVRCGKPKGKVCCT
jgi:hypothetical protein